MPARRMCNVLALLWEVIDHLGFLYNFCAGRAFNHARTYCAYQTSRTLHCGDRSGTEDTTVGWGWTPSSMREGTYGTEPYCNQPIWNDLFTYPPVLIRLLEDKTPPTG